MKYETIDGKMIDQIMEGREPDAPADWEDSTADTAGDSSQDDVSDSDQRPTIGGPAEQV